MQILCFFLFLFKGSSRPKCGFFHLAVLFRFYRVLLLHHVFLSEQIKMMMKMMMMIFCLKWKLPIIHCVKGITILNYLLVTTVKLICYSLSFQIQVTIFLLLTVLISFCPFLHVRLLCANKYTYMCWNWDVSTLTYFGATRLYLV